MIDIIQTLSNESEKIDLSELVDDTDLPILKRLQRYNSNPIGNTADLLILYTAAKKKMHYLITNDTSDFEPMLKEMSKDIPNNLQLKKNCYIQTHFIERPEK